MDICQRNLEEHFQMIKESQPAGYISNDIWNELCTLSHGITAGLGNLHDQSIVLRGDISTRTILVKQRGTVPQIVLPERSNCFNQTPNYSITWNRAL
jgi:hypothetical protein